MKRLTYFIATAGALSLASCHGTDHYNDYVENLKAQPAIIDTISSPQSYAAYIEVLDRTAQEFADTDVKLDDTQKDEIATLGMEIQKALVNKYEQLAGTPMTLPADFPVGEATDSVN